MQDDAHARYSPSQADRFFLCAGSVRECASAPPRPSSSYALEGTRAHDLLEAALNAGGVTAKEAWALDDAFKNDPLDAEMCAAVQDCIDYVNELIDLYDIDGTAVVYPERTINVPTVNCPGEADGHADVVIWFPFYGVLYVIDYKHGAGVSVDVVENRQVQQYGGGAVFGGQGAYSQDDVREVVLAIVQPRAFHPDGPIREWSRTPAQIYDYLLDLDVQISVCEDPRAALVPGEAQCRWCDAAPLCPALEAKSLSVTHHAFKDVKSVTAASLPEPSALPLERLVYIVQAQPLIKQWLDSVNECLLEHARAGAQVPGMKLVQAPPRRTWHGKPLDLARDMMRLLGKDSYYKDCATELVDFVHQWGDVDLVAEKLQELIEGGTALDEVMPRKLLTITDAEKFLKAQYKARVKTRKAKNKAAQDATQALAFFTVKDTSGVTSLAPLDDPRPAYSPAQDFAQVNVTSTGALK